MCVNCRPMFDIVIGRGICEQFRGEAMGKIPCHVRFCLFIRLSLYRSKFSIIL